MPAQCTHRVALHCGSVWGQHAEAKAVAKVSPDLPIFELQCSGDGKGVQPGQGGATGAALQSGPCVSPLHIAGDQESQQGSEAGFVGVSGVCALCCGNDAHAVWANLKALGQPQGFCLVMERLSHWARSSMLPSSSNGRRVTSPLCMALWVAAAEAK
jgi:hypothetical protein